MTLLISTFAAVAFTLAWYLSPRRKGLCLSFPTLMFWGASLMWTCDAVAEYLEIGAEFFNPEVTDMINDCFLGLSVVALGMVIWLIYLFIKDPEGIVKKSLRR